MPGIGTGEYWKTTMCEWYGLQRHGSSENVMDDDLKRFFEHTTGYASTRMNGTPMFEGTYDLNVSAL